jgi:hypothetical protein
MAADALSSHVHVMRMPSGIFSNVIRQRGIIMPIPPPVMFMGIIIDWPIPIPIGIMLAMAPVIVIPRSVVITFM